MVRLVFIPSFGTDSTLYDNLRSLAILKNECVFTEWLAVKKNDSLQDFALRFIDTYEIQSDDVLIGVSLGAVLAIEINKLIETRKIISISSISGSEEHPRLFNFLRTTGTYRLFFPAILKFGLDLIVPLYGKNVSSYLWFRRVFKKSDSKFLKWAFKTIIHWNNEERPENLIQIHGTKDPLFPINNASKIDHIIKGGTHAMIRFRAKEIALIIKKEISSL